MADDVSTGTSSPSTPQPEGGGGAPLDHSIEGVLSRRRERRKQKAGNYQPDRQGRQPDSSEESRVTSSYEDDSDTPSVHRQGRTGDSHPGEEPEPAAGDADHIPEGAPSDPESQPKADYIPGNALTRMQDGSVRPVGELKKAYGELQELKKAIPDVEAVRNLNAVRGQLQEQWQQLQQRAQHVDRLLPFVQQVLQTRMPQPPEPSLRETDPIEYVIQKDRYDQELGQFHYLQSQQEQRAQEEMANYETQRKEYIAQERQKLLSKRQELKERPKAEAFYGDLVAAAEFMGFSKADVDTVYDHRLVDGIVTLWRSHQRLSGAKTVAAQKVQGRPPVQMPGRRLGMGEAKAGQLDSLHKRARATGDLEDVVALRKARMQARQNGSGN